MHISINDTYIEYIDVEDAMRHRHRRPHIWEIRFFRIWGNHGQFCIPGGTSGAHMGEPIQAGDRAPPLRNGVSTFKTYAWVGNEYMIK